jgi:hypothetical protein
VETVGHREVGAGDRATELTGGHVTDWKNRISKAVTSASERVNEHEAATDAASQRRESEYLANLALYDKIIKPVFEEALPLLSVGKRVASIDEKPLIHQAPQAEEFESALYVERYDRWGGKTTLVQFSTAKRQDEIRFQHRKGPDMTSPQVGAKDITRAYLEDLIASVVEDFLSQ